MTGRKTHEKAVIKRKGRQYGKGQPARESICNHIPHSMSRKRRKIEEEKHPRRKTSQSRNRTVVGAEGKLGQVQALQRVVDERVDLVTVAGVVLEPLQVNDQQVVGLPATNKIKGGGGSGACAVREKSQRGTSMGQSVDVFGQRSKAQCPRCVQNPQPHTPTFPPRLAATLCRQPQQQQQQQQRPHQMSIFLVALRNSPQVEQYHMSFSP